MTISCDRRAGWCFVGVPGGDGTAARKPREPGNPHDRRGCATTTVAVTLLFALAVYHLGGPLRCSAPAGGAPVSSCVVYNVRLPVGERD